MRRAPLDRPWGWRRLVVGAPAPIADRHAYTLCAVERLQDSLRRRDVFVPRSERWGDPRVKLLQGARGTPPGPKSVGLWAGAKPLSRNSRRWRSSSTRPIAAPPPTSPTNAAVRLEQIKGRDTLTLTGLDKLEEPAEPDHPA